MSDPVKTDSVPAGPAPATTPAPTPADPVKLEAIGIDASGTAKPVDQISYAPAITEPAEPADPGPPPFGSASVPTPAPFLDESTAPAQPINVIDDDGLPVMDTANSHVKDGKLQRIPGAHAYSWTPTHAVQATMPHKPRKKGVEEVIRPSAKLPFVCLSDTPELEAALEFAKTRSGVVVHLPYPATVLPGKCRFGIVLHKDVVPFETRPADRAAAEAACLAAAPAGGLMVVESAEVAGAFAMVRTGRVFDMTVESLAAG